MLRCAIYGMGRWGQTLVDSVQGTSDKIAFTAGVARDPSKYKAYADGKDFPVFDDYARVLSDPQIDAVVLATPHSMHADHVQQAAEAGKHVFVEKPFTLTKESAAASVAACEQAGVILAVGFNRRFQPSVQALKAIVDGGKLGKILHIEGQHSGPAGYRDKPGNWRASKAENPAGGMCARGLHVLDLMVQCGGPVRSVYAISDRRVIKAERDDTTAMLLQFAGGVSGYLSTVMATGNFWRLQVIGSEGWAEMRGERQLAVSGLEGEPTVTDYDHVDIERAELEAFADCVATNTPFPVSYEDAIHGIAVLEAIERSAEQDRKLSIA